MTQHQSTAKLFLAKCIHHCSKYKTGSQQVCVSAITPLEIYCSYRVCSDPTADLCKTVSGKMHSPLLKVQNRFTAGLCQCNYTQRELLFTQVCSDPTPEHCNTVSGKNAFPTVQCCCAKQFHSRLVSVQLHPKRFASLPQCTFVALFIRLSSCCMTNWSALIWM